MMCFQPCITITSDPMEKICRRVFTGSDELVNVVFNFRFFFIYSLYSNSIFLVSSHVSACYHRTRFFFRCSVLSFCRAYDFCRRKLDRGIVMRRRRRYITVVVHSFDVFYHLILPFYKGLSVLNFPRSSVFLWFYFLKLHILVGIIECFILCIWAFFNKSVTFRPIKKENGKSTCLKFYFKRYFEYLYYRPVCKQKVQS